VAVIEIAGRRIGRHQPCYIIAEVSCNHEGSLDEALRIVQAAADCGADAVKVQTYTPDTMTRDFSYHPKDTMWEKMDLYGLYQKAYTPWEWLEPLQDRARELGLALFSSPFDETAVDFLLSHGVPAFKIASFEAVDTKLLQKVAETGLPVLMSSGMTDYLELAEAVATLRAHGCQSLALFQCNSGYPASFEDANLATIAAMKSVFGVPVGLSDHILFAGRDTEHPVVIAHVSPVEAVRLGADLIEVHLTLDRERARELHQHNKGGFDWAFSRNPEELRTIVQFIRQWESGARVRYETELEFECAAQCVGRVTFEPTQTEMASRRLRPSLWVTQAIAKGQPFRFAAGTRDGNFDSLRPGGGLAVRFTDVVQKHLAARDLQPGTPLAWEDIELQQPADLLQLRPARHQDARDVWEINRHASVRAAAFSQADIPWENHQIWFDQVLQDSSRDVMVACRDGEVVAVVRFEQPTPELGEISVSVKFGQRGRGIGRWAIAEATRYYLSSELEVKGIRAYIKQGNTASRHAFEAAGYQLQGTAMVQEHSVWLYHLMRKAELS
jgi:N-acetylneuraminate synthase